MTGYLGDRVTGVIYILFGGKLLLHSYGIWPHRPKVPGKTRSNPREYANIERVLGFFTIALGITYLIGI